MSPIDKLPAWTWTEQAAKEIALTGEQLLQQSQCAWRLGEVAVCGLIYTSFTSPPWGWFALAEGVTIRDLIDFKRLEKFIPAGTCVAVEKDFEVGKRFARLYGFEEVDWVFTQGDHSYLIYRRA